MGIPRDFRVFVILMTASYGATTSIVRVAWTLP